MTLINLGLYNDDKWEERGNGPGRYLRQILFQTPNCRREVIRLPLTHHMASHFHAGRDEIVVFQEGEGSLRSGGQKYPVRPGDVFFIPRGVSHQVGISVNTSSLGGLTYLIEATGIAGIMSQPSIWLADKQTPYQFSVYKVGEIRGQALAIPQMVQTRWQHPDKPSDPVQYIQRSLTSGSDVKIIVIYDNGKPIGSVFVGTSQGYDFEKTQAQIKYSQGDESQISPDDIWANYPSWEAPADHQFGFSSGELGKVWQTFTLACQVAFPGARQVLVRSRYHDIWSYVYIAPFWRVLLETNLVDWKWTAPDGATFNYGPGYERHGILALHL